MGKPESFSITSFSTISNVSKSITVDPSKKKFSNCQPRIFVPTDIWDEMRNIGPSKITNHMVDYIKDKDIYCNDNNSNNLKNDNNSNNNNNNNNSSV